MPKVVQFGWADKEYNDFVRRYATSYGCEYQSILVKEEMYKSADTLKYADFVMIWNGQQHYGPLATELCVRRQIPHAYYEWGLLQQSESFLVDPTGFCGKSVLCRDVSWVTEEDVQRLHLVRKVLQSEHELKPSGHVLVPLQIENDTQILYHTGVKTMNDFILLVEEMYPNLPVVVRPHPKSGGRGWSVRRARLDVRGTCLDAVRKASVVVGLTSTVLYESAILGVPTVALGDHALRLKSQAEQELVLAGVLAMRCERSTGDAGKILERFGIRPKGCVRRTG